MPQELLHALASRTQMARLLLLPGDGEKRADSKQSACLQSEDAMAEYHVICLGERKHEGPLVIEAESAEEAAAVACGAPVATRGSRACAEVYAANSSPYGLLTFYRD